MQQSGSRRKNHSQFLHKELIFNENLKTFKDRLTVT